MLNTKTLKKLFIITTVCAVPILLVAIKPSASTIPKKNALFLPNLLKKSDSISRLIIQDQQGTLTFEHSNNTWKILEKNNFPVLHDKVEELLYSLADLKIVEPKTASPEFFSSLDLEDVDQPNSKSLLVTVQDDQKHDLAKIIIGKREGLRVGEDYTENICVRMAGDYQTWIVQGTLPISSDFKDWVDQPLLGLIDADQLKQVSIINTNGEKVVIEKSTPEQEDFELLTAKDKPGMTLNIDTINTLPFEVAEIEFDDVLFAANQNVDWSKSLKADLETFSGIKIALEVVKQDGIIYSKVMAKSIDDSNEDLKQLAAAYNDSKQQWYYKLSQHAYDELTISNADFYKQS